MLKKIVSYLSILLSVVSCTPPVETTQFIVGFSQCTGEDAWREKMNKEIVRELSLSPNYSLSLEDAQGSTALQKKQIRELVQQGIHILIVSPNESDPLTPLIDSVYQQNIPVIILDRRTSNNQFTAYVGAKNYDVGILAGDIVKGILRRQNNYVVAELWGLAGSSPAQDRHSGFRSSLKNFAAEAPIEFHEMFGDWTENSVKAWMVDSLIHWDCAAVFAHNDFMAIELQKLLEERGIQLPIIGVDGLNGQGGGMEAVEQNRLYASILYPTGGQQAIEVARKVLEGESFQKENLLQSIVINKANVEAFRFQDQLLTDQLEQIIRQRQQLKEGQTLIRSQDFALKVLFVFLMLLALLIVFGGYQLIRNKRISRELHRRNEELQQKKSELEELSRQQEELTNEKLRFFTNLSHEFKTPLSLIIAPLQEMVENNPLSLQIKAELEIALRNSNKLLLLVNQLLDFRKIENKLFALRLSKVAPAVHIQQMIKRFEPLARSREIQLRLVDTSSVEQLWYDLDAVEKIIGNLLSNAFKFTPKKGSIHVELSNSERNFRIRVVDTGVGIPLGDQQYIFDRFYQGAENLSPGTGIGLALCKELIELHQGTIELESERSQGSIFTVRIPLAIEENKLVKRVSEDVLQNKNLDLSPIEDYVRTLDAFKDREPDLPGRFRLLLVEDDNDLAHFICHKLELDYTVLHVNNGDKAVQMLQKEPVDLVICDIMLPGRDGFSVLEFMSTHEDLKRIPAIVLSAADSVENRIRTQELGGVQFMTKPFNINLLKKSVRNQLERSGVINKDKPSSGLHLKKKINDVLLNKFSDPVFSATMLAEELNLSRVQLYRKVKDLYNISISELIVNFRLNQSKRMLEETQQSITEVATACGFSSPSYFSKAFKNQFGISPSMIKRL